MSCRGKQIQTTDWCLLCRG